MHLQGWFVYPPGIIRDIINFNTDCAIVCYACPKGRLFFHAHKKEVTDRKPDTGKEKVQFELLLLAGEFKKQCLLLAF